MLDITQLQSMVNQYRQIRKEVFQKATWAAEASVHEQNRVALSARIAGLCAGADLKVYRGSDRDTQQAVWDQIWIKIRYAGIKSKLASDEVASIYPMFSRWEDFAHPDWDIELDGWNVVKAGDQVRHFLDRSGPFENCITVGNVHKLKRTIGLARAYGAHLARGASPLAFLSAEHAASDVWAVHAHLQSIDYRRDITALHLMSDLGFDVVKPDIVITKLFHGLGWLDAIMALPADFSARELVGKGKYGNRYLYTGPAMYRPVIDLARAVAGMAATQDLAADIGWVTNNPLREFDIFMVKFGQFPEPEWGITRNLAREVAGGKTASGAPASGVAFKYRDALEPDDADDELPVLER